VIGETRTRAEQRQATRLAILDAAEACLTEDGYALLTTRRIAERAGVAQSTLMHHFPSRELLLTEAITHIATRLAQESLELFTGPADRDAVLDQAWRHFTSPQALAAAQLWAAAWAEPELAGALRELEERLSTILVATAEMLFPDVAGKSEFPALIDLTVSLIRGLVMAIPVAGQDEVDARWAAMKPMLLEASDAVLA
jgi:AcrR family transcriptional regulator